MLARICVYGRAQVSSRTTSRSPMRNRLILFSVSLSAVLGFSQVSLAQTKPFDPHSLSGYWVMSPAGRRPASIGNNRPPFTPAGQAKFLATVTGFGNRELGHTPD